jgi:hypothetical protein
VTITLYTESLGVVTERRQPPEVVVVSHDSPPVVHRGGYL